MAFKKRVRIIKKIREAASLWRFISLHRIHGRYVWDKRPGYYFVEWWEGRKRRRADGQMADCSSPGHRHILTGCRKNTDMGLERRAPTSPIWFCFVAGLGVRSFFVIVLLQAAL